MTTKFFENELKVYSEDRELLDVMKSSYIQIIPDKGKAFKKKSSNSIINGSIYIGEGGSVDEYEEVDKE